MQLPVVKTPPASALSGRGYKTLRQLLVPRQAINEEQFFHLPSAAAAALEEAGAAAFRGAVKRRRRSQTIISLSA